MRIAHIYSHLNGHEHMLVHHKDLWDEIVDAINSIDANVYTKISKAKPSFGRVLYDQKALNKQFEAVLFPQEWQSVTTQYYVTGDIPTAREIASIRDKEEQRRIIERNGHVAFRTNNQVDFVKNRVAVKFSSASILALLMTSMLNIHFSS